MPISLITLGHSIDCPEERGLQKQLGVYLGKEILVPPIREPRLQLKSLRVLNRYANAPSGGLFVGIYAEVLEYLALQGITVLFTGEGGDEVFAPNPESIADFLLRRNWGSALQAIGFFTSLDGESNSLQTLTAYGLLPMLHSMSSSKTSRLLIHWFETGRMSRSRDAVNKRFLSRLLGGFSAELNGVTQLVADDLRRRLEDGFSWSSYHSYRRVLEVPYYSARWPDPHNEAARSVRVVNPLADLKVFRAAMTLRLEERVGTWLGFRSKRLLHFAVSNRMPPSAGHYPKIGVNNLVSKMTRGIEESVVQILLSGSLEHIGINPDPRLADPRTVPASVSLYWVLLLSLMVWFEELKNNVRQN